jgi:hypothetical protein
MAPIKLTILVVRINPESKAGLIAQRLKQMSLLSLRLKRFTRIFNLYFP